MLFWGGFLIGAWLFPAAPDHDPCLSFSPPAQSSHLGGGKEVSTFQEYIKSVLYQL